MFYKLLFSCLSIVALMSSVSTLASQKRVGDSFVAHNLTGSVTIDGEMEGHWNKANWYPLDQLIIGDSLSKQDFSGRFKLLWDKNYLYLVAEITDDVLFDQHADPLYFYWDDDCLEIFIDEDASGGNHQYNYNAFAYHVALDNQSVDIGEKTADNPEPFLLLNDHIKSVWKRSSKQPNKIIWEVAIKVFDDSFKPSGQTQAVELFEGKKLGFMLAYCDNDGSKNREHFIGSTEILPVNGDRNLGYIDASVFGTLTLVK